MRLYRRETLTQVFLCDIFQSTYFEEAWRRAVSKMYVIRVTDTD